MSNLTLNTKTTSNKFTNLKSRRKYIKEVFKTVGSELGCHIPMTRSKKEPLETMSCDRLVEHMLYWYLDSTVNRSELNQQWDDTSWRKHGVEGFKLHPLVKLFLSELF